MAEPKVTIVTPSINQARLLVFGYLPPPIHGVSIAYQALLRSPFARQFDVSFINLNVVRDYRELEVFHWRKLARLGRLIGTEWWRLTSQRFDFAFYPISINRSLKAAPKATSANSKAVSAATTGKAQPTCSPPTSTTKPPPAF